MWIRVLYFTSFVIGQWFILYQSEVLRWWILPNNTQTFCVSNKAPTLRAHNWPNYKSDSIFFVFKKKNFYNNMVTCDQQEKVLSSQKVILWIFLEIRNLFWRYAELNRFLVGTDLILLNIELQQDDRTVCCAHRIVWVSPFLQIFIISKITNSKS